MTKNALRPEAAAGRRWEAIALAGVVALAAGVYFGTARLDGPFFSPNPQGYYGLLTAGFRAGHLHAAADPSPALLALKDPYDPVANAPYRAHDMILWRGRYYLYPGVAPVLLFFWPLAAATGRYPSEAFAVACFCTAAAAAAAAFLAAVRRTYFPAAPPALLLAAAACVALAGPLPVLAAGSRVYEVPIACAAGLQMLLLAALFGALRSRRPAAWLAAAGLLYGLSVASRPNCILEGAAFFFPIWALARRHPRGAARTARLCLAALAPAALCGLGLAWYNWERFGSPAEFGMRYQLAGESLLHARLFSLGNVPSHAALYAFEPGIWQRYFPFFLPRPGFAYGFLRYLPWCWLGWALLFAPGARGREGEELRAMSAAVACTAAANLFLLCCFFGGTPRYMADFVPAFSLLGGMGALAVGTRRSRPWGLAMGAAAASSLVVGLSALAAVFPRPEALAGLARLCDRPAAFWEQATGRPVGGLRLELQLPEGGGGGSEPLFETGAFPDQRDWLQLDYLPGRRARLGVFHAGLGLVAGADFAIPADGRIAVEARGGWLMPPFEHPAFTGWSRADYDRAARDARVTVNGTEQLRAALAFYPAPPDSLSIGTRPWSGDGLADRFSGRVLSWRRLPLEARPAAPALRLREGLPVELTVVFPADRSAGKDPLLATGPGPEGDLLYCLYDGVGRVRFGFDHADSGGPVSDPVAYQPGRPYRIRAWMGSLSGPAGGTSARRGVVWWQDRPVINEECRFTPAAASSARLGRNPFASTELSADFGGLVLGVAQPDRGAGLPPLPDSGRWGSIDLEVRFPQGALGTAEPLAVTGATGAGDLLYVTYLDAAHVAFGFDHWGFYSRTTGALPADYAKPHRIEIDLGSLHPRAGEGIRPGRLLVKLDGVPVLDQAADFFPSEPGQISIGRNNIGGSTCGARFTGRIVRARRKDGD